MRAVMLAAGVGRRLTGPDDSAPPKCLLRFAGRSLLDRHVENLRRLGFEELVLVVGYNAAQIEAEIDALAARGFVRLLHNPDFRHGSVLSLWTARDVLRAGGEVLFMDADVLYDPAILERMLAQPEASCFPFDRGFEEGDEPVKLCLREGRAVEFRKRIGAARYDTVGEWIGFIRMAPGFAARVAAETERFVAEGRVEEPYEEAVRAVLLAEQAPVGFADVTGLPWIEIDFPEDVARAEARVLTAIEGG